MVQPLWETVWRFLRKLKIELPYDPAIPLLGKYLDKTIIQNDTCVGPAQKGRGRMWKGGPLECGVPEFGEHTGHSKKLEYLQRNSRE